MSGPERDDVFEAHEIRVWRFVLNELLTNGFVVQERDGDALAVTGKPDFDAAWLMYRQQTLHGLYNWFFVASMAASGPAIHANELCRRNVNRMAVAADDLKTLDALYV